MEPDKKQKLIEIVKSATLPPEAETMMLDEINKQTEITDDFILQVSDLLERLGNYFKTASDVQSEYLDSLLEEAKRVGGSMDMLESIATELEEGEDNAPSAETTAAPAPVTEAPPQVQPEVPQPQVPPLQVTPAETPWQPPTQ